MSCTHILTDNWIGSDVYENEFVSSEQANFPGVNTDRYKRRAKLWRSAGYWNITSSNNLVKFQETIGINQSVTLTVGEYTDTTLFAEIKSKMESAGASTYTISRDTTTNKIKFTSDGTGGTGVFVLKWDDAFPLAALLGYSATAHSGALTYTAETLKIHEEEWIKWDLGLPSTPKAFAMVGPRTYPIKISPSATIKIQGNETDAWTSPSYDQTLTYYGDSFFVIDTDGLHTDPLRWWRYYVVDTANPAGHVEAGAFFLGDIFDSTRGGAQFPFGGSYVDRSPTVFSEGGESFSDLKTKTERFGLDWFGLTVADKESIDLFSDEYGTSKPFFVAIDTLGTNVASRGNYYLRYVKNERDPSFSLETTGVYRIRFEFREEL